MVQLRNCTLWNFHKFPKQQFINLHSSTESTSYLLDSFFTYLPNSLLHFFLPCLSLASLLTYFLNSLLPSLLTSLLTCLMPCFLTYILPYLLAYFLNSLLPYLLTYLLTATIIQIFIAPFQSKLTDTRVNFISSCTTTLHYHPLLTYCNCNTHL